MFPLDPNGWYGGIKATPAKPARPAPVGEVFRAVEAGDLERTRELLDTGFDLRVRDTRKRSEGRTLLHTAVLKGHDDLVRLLLEWPRQRADPDLRDWPERPSLGRVAPAAETRPRKESRLGVTPLMVAAALGNGAAVEALIAAHADLDRLDAAGRSARRLAVENGHPHVVRLLDEAGAAADPDPRELRRLHDPLPRLTPELRRHYASNAVSERLKARSGDRGFVEIARRLSVRLNASVRAERSYCCGFDLEVSGIKDVELVRLQKELGEEGAFLCTCVVDHEVRPRELWLAPTADPYEAVAAIGPDGIRDEVDTEHVIAWLMEQDETTPFRLLNIHSDAIRIQLKRRARDPAALAERVESFCPFVVEKELGSMDDLVEALRKKRPLMLWWD